MADVTELLRKWADGDLAAFEALVPLVYGELNGIASRLLRNERPNHTLETRALVHEAYLRLVNQSRMHWDSRTHFYGAAANIMRRVLVDQARRRLSEKRGRGVPHDRIDLAIAVASEPDMNVLALDEALEAFAQIDPARVRIVELRYFAGLTLDETAAALSVSAGREPRLGSRQGLAGEAPVMTVPGDRWNEIRQAFTRVEEALTTSARRCSRPCRRTSARKSNHSVPPPAARRSSSILMRDRCPGTGFVLGAYRLGSGDWPRRHGCGVPR